MGSQPVAHITERWSGANPQAPVALTSFTYLQEAEDAQ